MIDLYLMQMMKGGNGLHQKPPLEIKSLEETELDKEIDALAEEMAENAFNEIVNPNNLMSPEAQKQRFKTQFKEELSAKDSANTMKEAIEIMNQEIENLDPEQKERLSTEFNSAIELLDEESKSKEPDLKRSLKDVAKLSDRAIDIIVHMATNKYTEKDFIACKTLYAFLIILDDTNFEHWQRLGICLHELSDFENAIHAYEKAWMIDAGNIPNRLFVAECYFKLNNKQLAEEICKAAKDLIESQQALGEWGEHLNALQESIFTLR